MERLYYLARLYDLYGGLLTGKQRESLRLHIAEMEETLGLLARQQAQEHALAAVCADLRALKEPIACVDVCRIVDELEQYTSQNDIKEVRE